MPQTNHPLSNEELDRLAEILEDESMPMDILDISGLHGFLTAIIIGPKPMAPNEWLPKIFGEEEQEIPMVFDDMETLDEFIELTLRFYNQIMDELKSKEKFTPIVYRTIVDGKEHYIIEDWCFGFMRGVATSIMAWAPLLDSEEGEKLLAVPLLFGTWEGLEQMEEKLNPEMYEVAVHVLPQVVFDVMDFWNKYFSKTHNKTIH